MEKLSNGEIELENETHDSFTYGDYMKTCYQKENKELIIRGRKKKSGNNASIRLISWRFGIHKANYYWPKPALNTQRNSQKHF